MKNKLLMVAAVMLTSALAFGQEHLDKGVVKLRGTRLTYPLVNRWITEFKKEHPGIQVSIRPSAPVDSIDFNIASYALTSNDLTGNREGVAIARYVQLPIVNSQRPGLSTLQTKGVTEKALNDLFFTDNTPVFFTSSKADVTLYTRDRPVCAAKTFVNHFGNEWKDLQGQTVQGDDKDLADAVQKDVNGVSFNNLGFIYDVKTRTVTEGLVIVPLDLNENGQVDQDEQVYGTLDEVIAFVEKTNHSKFITERVNVIFNKESKNAAAGLFLNWVLSKGQKFNHDLGFLNLEPNVLTQQKILAAANFKVSSAASCEGATQVLQQRKKRVN